MGEDRGKGQDEGRAEGGDEGGSEVTAMFKAWSTACLPWTERHPACI